jgi:hypothetical protein
MRSTNGMPMHRDKQNCFATGLAVLERAAAAETTPDPVIDLLAC